MLLIKNSFTFSLKEISDQDPDSTSSSETEGQAI